MSFRTRLFIALAAVALAPLILFMLGVRNAVTRRLLVAAERDDATMLSVLEGDLAREAASIRTRLDGISALLRDDSRFRAAAVLGDESARRYELDYAGRAMRSAGFALLVVHDSVGRIVSSGQFRNEYDRILPALLTLSESSDRRATLVRARTPGGPFLALVVADTARVGPTRYGLVGGVAADSVWLAGLARDPVARVGLRLPDSPESPASVDVAIGRVPFRFVDLADPDRRSDTAWVVVSRRGSTLAALRRETSLWFTLAAGAAAVLALAVAAWLAERTSRPLLDLAAKTAAIDLERLDQDFTLERRDEVGTLARVLRTMTDRLRSGALRLREAERRAATGDLARQVNHDVKNGLVPIRNVVRHLTTVARTDPASLARIFEERRATLEESIGHLDTLARNYARLAPDLGTAACDVNRIARSLVRDFEGRASIQATLAEDVPLTAADETTVRRILENLLMNAIESYEDGRPASVSLTTSVHRDGGPAFVRIVVADTGRGMSRDELDRAFEDFYTTKPTGTGLGLSVVRRLTADLAGALRVETEPATGTRMVIDLPAREPR